MKRVVLIVLAMVLAISMVAVGCPEPIDDIDNGEEPIEPIELSFACGGPETSFMYLTAKAAGDWLEEQSEGRVQVTYYTGGSLLGYTDSYSGVVGGVADWSDVITAMFPGQFPLSFVLELVPGYPTGTVYGRDSMTLVQEYLLDEWKDVKVLYVLGVQGNNLITRDKKIQHLDDLADMRIRASGLGLKVVEKWGAVPVSIPTGEMYESLQRGAVDGVLTQDSALISLGLADVCQYTHHLFPFQNGCLSVMNLEKYNSLPDDIKALVDQLADWVPEECGRIVDQQSDAGIQALLEAGGEVVTFTAEERAVFLEPLAAINDEWAAELEDQGLPARAVLDARNEMVAGYTETI